MISSRLAGFKCPNCDTIQPYDELIKTRPNLFGSLENTVCSNCSAKLWIEEGRGLVNFAMLLFGLFCFLPVIDPLRSYFFDLLGTSYSGGFLDKFVGPAIVGIVVFYVLSPIAARVYKIGHTQ